MTDTEKLILEKLDLLDQKINMVDEKVDKVNDRLEVMEIKQKMTHKKLNNLALDLEVTKKDIRSDIHALSDETETIIAVMEAKGILPKVIND